MIERLSVAGFLMMVGGLAALILRQQAFSTAPVAIVMQVCAVALMLWARVTFGGRSFHATASATEGGLVTTGPYRWVRHPIYTAVCLFTLGCVVGHPSLFALGMAALVTAGSLVRMLAEETSLASRYPDYTQYARKTKRMVPFVF